MASTLRSALLTLVLLLCLASGSSQLLWPIQHVPVVWPQQTEERPPPHFLQLAQLKVTSSCGLEYTCWSLQKQTSDLFKLSTGCSGTLVGDRHVLTAAHCIHDGKNYVKGAQRLRVGFLKPQQKDMLGRNITNTRPDKMTFQWIRVKHTYVPMGWIKCTANNIGMDYDNALLELKKPQFSGFDNDRPGQLVYRFCEAGDESYDLLYQHCDAQPGASGSGVYARMWNRRRQCWE
uniref:Serine protease 23 n=1 Tax=Sinocyclocheilus grahami TaxID=75366 RepID=A0A672KQ74_SINGR